jgi:uncharacterized protein
VTHAKPFNLSHFAINAEDTERALAFYKGVFNWEFTAWGPPNFFLINTGDGIHGALQGVQQDPVPTKVGAYECTVTVEDVDETVAAIVRHGGTIQVPKTTIPGVGDIARVFDTEGNLFCIAKYSS